MDDIEIHWWRYVLDICWYKYCESISCCIDKLYVLKGVHYEIGITPSILISVH